MNKCPKCHTENRTGAGFCIECGSTLSAEAQGAGPRMCPAGKHPMDPAWGACPYCSGPQQPAQQQGGSQIPPLPGGGERKREPTVAEGYSAPAPPARVDVAPDPVKPAAGGGGKKRTEFHETPQQPHPQHQGASAPLRPPQQPGVRRIVAVLATYSWLPEGQIFPVYEGRNYLGRDADCEICLTADPQMSGRQCGLFFRGGQFVITDEKSMNGTVVNDIDVPLTGMSLDNYATIKTGATTWRFIIIEPAGE